MIYGSLSRKHSLTSSLYGSKPGDSRQNSLERGSANGHLHHLKGECHECERHSAPSLSIGTQTVNVSPFVVLALERDCAAMRALQRGDLQPTRRLILLMLDATVTRETGDPARCSMPSPSPLRRS